MSRCSIESTDWLLEYYELCNGFMMSFTIQFLIKESGKHRLSAIILKLTRKAVPDVSSCSLQKVEICSQHCLSKRLLCPNLVEEGAKRVDCYPKF
ncbi:hypothetical protein C5167_025801 [Papaver somniferum]|uniref:Uncharacterized protein n=1 Tax=Papaver somniferum TaxID=3469 RepID=A0A4Y7JVI0_PAPSO|nr:hypothetical protein C5167_025801 [Papaver somniferum]